MAYEPKDGDISLFKADKKDNPKRPDMTGKALIDGQEYNVSMWSKGEGDKRFLSGRIELRQAKVESSKPETTPLNDFPESDLPF